MFKFYNLLFIICAVPTLTALQAAKFAAFLFAGGKNRKTLILFTVPLRTTN
jgi:hypothetical protein